jgi:hypothetical protein
MTKIVDLQSFRERALEQKSYGPWQKRFGEPYGPHPDIGSLRQDALQSGPARKARLLFTS